MSKNHVSEVVKKVEKQMKERSESTMIFNCFIIVKLFGGV